MNQYQQFIHQTRYARWLPEQKRRETWEETVERYIGFFYERFKEDWLYDVAKPAILDMRVMPSMRALMSAGEALRRENLAGYNCAYIAVDYLGAFSEALYVLMCGTGVGFSCERQYVNQLPTVPQTVGPCSKVITVQDSKEGWGAALREHLERLYQGQSCRVDYRLVRPAGTPLKVFGGRASGPDPLERLIEFARNTILSARGRKLTSIEVHDLMCMIGDVVVVGGVRRSALLSLSNLSDRRMRDAKSGEWWTQAPHRALANNSVAYTERPESEIFLEEWLSLVKSKSGERGMFNRQASQRQAAKWGRRSNEIEYGTNPCSEIILRSQQLCNLTEVIIRPEDTEETLEDKIEIATVLGTMQASLTDFNFVGPRWAKNTREEALLGVSLTGIMDNKITADPSPAMLEDLRKYSRTVNHAWADRLGVNRSTAITCVKPSGTVSQLCDTASGIHTRHAKHYIRRVRIDKKDPVYDLIVEAGLDVECAIGKEDSTAVVSFPTAAPPGCVTRDDQTALQALDVWLRYQRHWCEHKPSVTINVREGEWPHVGGWVYDHFDELSGISFLPHDGGTYRQAPYEEITEQQYRDLPPVPHVDWAELSKYETHDQTQSTQTLACTGGNCEI